MSVADDVGPSGRFQLGDMNGPWWLLLFVAGAAFLVPNAPGIFDAGELTAAAIELGGSHPPGQPLHALLAHSFTWLPFGTLAFRIALFSAVTEALDAFEVLFTSNSEPIGVLIAATIIYAVGFIDDIRDISPPAKVAGTVIAGLALVQFGVVMYVFRLPFYDGPILIGEEWRALVTVLWLLGMTQAVNLIDGLDGLAAGIVAIGAGAFFLYSQQLIDSDLLDVKNIGPLLAIIAVGVCIGFLPHNFNPARIMMGDGGALLLGLLLAVATSVVGGRADSFNQEFIGQTYFFLAPLVIPLLILGVPIFDLLFAIFRRATSRSSIATADKGHLHHRLMDLGHGHRRSVVILWTWTLLLSAFVLYPTLTGRNPAYLPFGIVALGIGLYTAFHPSVRARRRASGRSHDS